MTTTAADIMSTEILTVTEETTLEEALKIITNSKITGMPVIDKDGKMIGVVSDYDILKQMSGKKPNQPGVFQERIEYSRDVFTVKTTTPIEELVEFFIDKRFRRLPVLEKTGRLVGIISRRDLMRVFYYRAKLL